LHRFVIIVPNYVSLSRFVKILNLPYHGFATAAADDALYTIYMYTSKKFETGAGADGGSTFCLVGSKH